MAVALCPSSNYTLTGETLSHFGCTVSDDLHWFSTAQNQAYSSAQIESFIAMNNFVQEALYNVDPLIVEAIFGGGLLLFVIN